MDWLISSCLPTHTLLKSFVSSLFCSMVNVRVRMSLMVLCTWFLCDLRRVFAFAIEHWEFSPEFISIVHSRFGSGFHHHTFFVIIIGILSVAHPFNYSPIFANLFVHSAQNFVPPPCNLISCPCQRLQRHYVC